MKKYVQVGCGTRGVISYAVPLVKECGEYGELAGVYDPNHKRAKLVSEYVGKEIPVFDDFTEMLETVKPDAVIVTTVDCVHDEYVISALEAGCDVICEKPLTTTFEKANAILRAWKKTGKDITVTFNLRYHPFFVRLKKIVDSGVAGTIMSVHFEWMIRAMHGADYFRRWHGSKENSGSLLVHKSTHHFDIANWLIGEDPVSVNAYGTQRFFGPNRKAPAKRCLECKDRCEFYMDVQKDENLKKLYYDCEDVDGYFRDGCVFSEGNDIEDNVSVNVMYSGGTVMSYTLSVYSPYEGMRIVINGTEGRIEASNVDKNVKIFKHNGENFNIDLPAAKLSAHGGADEKIRDSLFKGKKDEVALQTAGLKAGLMSIGIGMAANVSLKENRRVELSEFLDRLD